MDSCGMVLFGATVWALSFAAFGALSVAVLWALLGVELAAPRVLILLDLVDMVERSKSPVIWAVLSWKVAENGWYI